MRQLPTRAEKSRMIPFYLDFVQANTYHFDLMNYAPLRTISRVLAFYIDNSNNNKTLTLFVYKSGQTIVAQPNTQGFYPVLDYASTFAFFATSEGSSASATVFACNYLVPPGTWGPAANVTIPNPLPITGTVEVGNFPATQAVELYDAAGNAISSTSGSLDTLEYVTYSAGAVHPELRSNEIATFNSTTSTGTLITGNPGYFISSFELFVNMNNAISGGTIVAIDIVDSSYGSIFHAPVYIPSSVPTNLGPSALIIPCPPDYFWNNKTANSTLKVTVSATLSGGYGGIINYGKCSFVG